MWLGVALSHALGIVVTSSALSAFLPFSLILDALKNFL